MRLAKSRGIGSSSSRLVIIWVKPAGVYNLITPVGYDFRSAQFDDAVRAAMPAPGRLRPGFRSLPFLSTSQASPDKEFGSGM